MRFANSEGVRASATPKATGTCPACDSPVLARCGSERIWHWAHKSYRNCDTWWDNETLWHRNWKAEFPDDWNEVIQTSATGERHIADVKTPTGLVIEFQHSSLTNDERAAREAFYGSMIWVVDGTRLKRDGDILAGLEHGRRIARGVAHSIFNAPAYQITRRWGTSRKPVVLDFHGSDLWCISPFRNNWQSFAVQFPRKDFVDSCLVGQLPPAMLSLLNGD
jgi:hypothetical protein